MTAKKSVWETLSAINVNDHTEKKQGLTYLSWAWAWGVLKKHYPSASFTKHIQPDGTPVIKDENGSAYVQVTVTVEGESVTELFPVLDYKNKSISHPDSFAVNTAMQRALAKAISYHGLGHYIYAGEDLPQDDAPQSASGARSGGSGSSRGSGAGAADGGPQGQQDTPDGIPDVRGPDGSKLATGTLETIAAVFSEFVPLCETQKDLEKLWVTNKEALQTLKEQAPDLHSGVRESFTKRKAQIKESKA